MIDVQIRSTGGRVVESITGVGVDGFGLADPAAYPLLAHVLPRSDTVFNTRQVVDLADELTPYERDSELNSARTSFGWLRDMCARVADEPHLMLWFVGD